MDPEWIAAGVFIALGALAVFYYLYMLITGWKNDTCVGDHVERSDGKCVPKQNCEVPCVGERVEISGSDKCIPKPYNSGNQCVPSTPIGSRERFALLKNSNGLRYALSYVQGNSKRNGEGLEWRSDCTQHSIDFYMHTAPHLFTSDGRAVCWHPADSNAGRRRLVLGDEKSNYLVEFTITLSPDPNYPGYTIRTQNPNGSLNIPVNSDVASEGVRRATIDTGTGSDAVFNKVQCGEGNCCDKLPS